MKYKIYAGLGGGFNSTDFQGTFEFDTLEQANDRAWELACQEYEQYEGMYGLRSVDDIMEEDLVGEDEAWDIYVDERESWIDYYVVREDEKAFNNGDE